MRLTSVRRGVCDRSRCFNKPEVYILKAWGSIHLCKQCAAEEPACGRKEGQSAMPIQNVNELPELQPMIDGGYVSVRKHPWFKLRIYNYTAKAQYESVWNETTLACRGLIALDTGHVVARPFVKFFNVEQFEALPDEPYDVFEKYDGSLGIMYFVNCRPYIATRGSFDSPQAKVANEMLESDDMDCFDDDYTYLFEIIHPKTHVVVDYAGAKQLVLLAIVHTESGEEITYGSLLWRNATRHRAVQWAISYQRFDLKKIRKMIDQSSGEGVVLRYLSGLRVKMKSAECVRLHRLICDTSLTTIWELLRNGQSVDSLLGRVPDEFYQWVHGSANVLRGQFAVMQSEAALELCGIRWHKVGDNASRKEIAAEVSKSVHKAVMFAMLDGKNYDQIIWKAIKPAAGQTFREDNGL